MVPRMHTASPKYPVCPSLVPVPEARPPQLAGAAKCWVLPGELAQAVESGGTLGCGQEGQGRAGTGRAQSSPAGLQAGVGAHPGSEEAGGQSPEARASGWAAHPRLEY